MFAIYDFMIRISFKRCYFMIPAEVLVASPVASHFVHRSEQFSAIKYKFINKSLNGYFE